MPRDLAERPADRKLRRGVAWRPPVAFASSSIWKMPSASAAGSKRSACSPARFQLLAIVATSAPSGSRTLTVTSAGELSV